MTAEDDVTCVSEKVLMLQLCAPLLTHSRLAQNNLNNVTEEAYGAHFLTVLHNACEIQFTVFLTQW